MTIGGAVLGGFISIVVLLGIIGCIVYARDTDSIAVGIMGAVIGFILIAGTWLGLVWYFNNTAEGFRKLKTQKSNLTGGITREITVYSMDGKVLEQFRGKFDIEYADERILFDDENGDRHIIYFKSGTVIVNEVS